MERPTENEAKLEVGHKIQKKQEAGDSLEKASLVRRPDSRNEWIVLGQKED